MKKRNVFLTFLDGIYLKNPVFSLFLGLTLAILVTTNVQLFESLLAASPSRCRKLHNIANSVIIRDEAQKIPAEHLRAVLSALKGLVKHFGVTVLLCTATRRTFSLHQRHHRVLHPLRRHDFRRPLQGTGSL